MRSFDEKDLHCVCTALKDTTKIIYVLSPVDLRSHNLSFWANETGANIVFVYGLDWKKFFVDSDPDTDTHVPSAERAKLILEHMQTQLLPTIEKALGYTQVTKRGLVGISWSGLFTLWAFLKSDTFNDICCISPWLNDENIKTWINSLDHIEKDGHALFLVSDNDTDTPNTSDSKHKETAREFVDILCSKGLKAFYESTDTDSKAFEPRIRRFLEHIIERNSKK